MLRRLVTSKAVYLLLGFVLAAFLLARVVEEVGGPEGVWDRLGFLAPAISVPLHTMMAISPMPSDVLSAGNGTVYGLLMGALLNWIAWFMASFIQFGIGRRMGEDFDVESWMARSPERLRRFPVGHPLFLIVSRYVPYAGGHISTLIPGARGVPISRFAWCTAVSLVPPAFVMAGVGVGLLLF